MYSGLKCTLFASKSPCTKNVIGSKKKNQNMWKSPLIVTLRLLSNQELETLDKFVRSEIFHRDLGRLTLTVRLFEMIRERLIRREYTFDEREIREALLGYSRKNPQGEMNKLKAQLFDIVKQYITFSNFISVTPVRKKNKTKKRETNFHKKGIDSDSKMQAPKGLSAIKSDPNQFLSYSRQELALMRFFNQRLNLTAHESLRESEKSRSKKSTSKATASKIKKAENFISTGYNRLSAYFQVDNQEPVSYISYNESQFQELLYHQFLLEHEMLGYQNLFNDKIGVINLPAAAAKLDQFYILTRLEIALRWHMQKMVSNPHETDHEVILQYENIEKGWDNFIEVILSQPAYLNHPLFELYLNAIKLIKTPVGEGDALYMKMLEQLKKSTEALPEEKQKDLFAIIRNYLASTYNRTKMHQYLDQLHQLHRSQLEEGLLTFNSGHVRFIHRSQLHGMISVASKLRDFEWMHSVLAQFPSERIVPSQQSEVFWRINMTNVLFEQGKYEDARKTLGSPTAFRSIHEQHYRLWAIRLYTKILFETGELGDYDGIQFLRAARVWLLRVRNLETKRRDANMAFLSIAKMLTQSQTKMRNSEKLEWALEVWTAAIEQKPAEYEWLVQKIQMAGSELMGLFLDGNDAYRAKIIVRKIFGGYLEIPAIATPSCRYRIMVLSAKLLYLLNFLRPPKSDLLFKGAVDYLTNEQDLEIEERREITSFLNRVRLLHELRALPSSEQERIKRGLETVRATIFKRIEDDWITSQIKMFRNV